MWPEHIPPPGVSAGRCSPRAVGWTSEVQVQAGLAPPEAWLLGVDVVLSLCPHGRPPPGSVSRSPLIGTLVRLHQATLVTSFYPNPLRVDPVRAVTVWAPGVRASAVL